MKIVNVMNKTQKGLTLVEMLVVIGIAAVIVTLALNLFSSTSEENKVGQEVKNIATLNAGVKSMFASAQSYAGLDNTTLLGTNVIPSHMRGVNAGEIKHSWDPTGVTVQPSAGDTKFQIIYNNVPDASCVSLASATMNGAQTLDVNGAVVDNPALAVGSCNAGDANVMTWTYL